MLNSVPKAGAISSTSVAYLKKYRPRRYETTETPTVGKAYATTLATLRVLPSAGAAPALATGFLTVNCLNKITVAMIDEVIRITNGGDSR